jgi:tRNA threonylcarbamoyladenosine biosynthesis protein TsaB
MLLALDTSTTQTGIACYDETGLLAEALWQSGRNHTTQTLPQLDLLLRHIRRTQQDIRVIAVALGPGSWSGLRVGLAMAKGLAMAGELAVVGISTLDMLAAQHCHPHMTTYPLLQLGRARYATATFAWASGANSYERASDYRNTTLAELATEIEGLEGPCIVCGDVGEEERTSLQERLGHRVYIPPGVANVRRPGYLAEQGWKRFLAGDCDDLARLEPIYLGDPVKKRA